jgi:hypothetical protein
VSITWSIVSNPGPDSTYNLGDQIRIVGGPFPTGSNTNTQYIQVFVGGVSRQVAYNGASFDGSVTTFTFIYNVDATDNSSSGISIPSSAVYGESFAQQTFGSFSVIGTPAVSYSMSPSSLTATEGSQVTFTVSTTNVSAGQSLRYSFSGFTNSDLSVPTTGNLIVDSSGSATLSLQFINDNTPEGTETATLTVGEVLQDSRYSNFVLERGVTASIALSDQAGGSASTPICFARGTQINTARGLALVESLNSDATVIDFNGKNANVKWIGYQRRTPEFAQFDDYLPVKICAGALEENVPVRDLYLSPDHGVLVDGHLIHAQALVNGRTIIKMTEWEGDIEYYHIETENHEIIFAEGVPCETFIDNVSREQFDNYAEYQALHPYTQMMRELPLPRVKFRRQMPSAIWRRLMERADLITAAQDQA